MSTRPPLLRGPRLELRRASLSYPESGFRLAPVSLDVQAGEVVALVGPNASGKSTILKLASGLLIAEAGSVLLDGQPVAGLSLRQRARRVGVVQQESPLLFPIRVLPFVLQGRHAYLRPLQLETAEDLRVARGVMEVTRTAHLADRWMQDLSGGEKQRVILARALAQQPELLLLDEPTLHLDIAYQVELLRLVRALARQEQYAVLLVTHELNLAAEFADRALLLHQGELVRAGTPAEAFERELLERVFQTELDVFIHPETGRPRVVVRAEAEGGEPSGEKPTEET